MAFRNGLDVDPLVARVINYSNFSDAASVGDQVTRVAVRLFPRILRSSDPSSSQLRRRGLDFSPDGAEVPITPAGRYIAGPARGSRPQRKLCCTSLFG